MVRLIFLSREKENTGSSQSNLENKTQARRVSPAGEGAAELYPSLPGMFQDVSGPG